MAMRLLQRVTLTLLQTNRKTSWSPSLGTAPDVPKADYFPFSKLPALILRTNIRKSGETKKYSHFKSLNEASREHIDAGQMGGTAIP